MPIQPWYVASFFFSYRKNNKSYIIFNAELPKKTTGHKGGPDPKGGPAPGPKGRKGGRGGGKLPGETTVSNNTNIVMVVMKLHFTGERGATYSRVMLRLRCTVCSLIIHELLLLFISPTTLIFM